MSKRKAPGWLPRQHGAWAMLVVPFAVGLILRGREGGLPPFVWPLFACWMLGYFAFNAASLYIKAPPAWRPALARPLLAYAMVSGLFGLLTLYLAGFGLLGWVPVFAALLTPALVLTARGRERSTLSGGLTTAAASLLVLVIAHPDPTGLLAAGPASRAPVAAALVFAYFFGTVLYVKSNIRERGNRAYQAGSVGWHALVTLAAVGLALGGVASWALAVLFGLGTVRAWVVPRLRRPLIPLRIGLLEIVFSAGVLLIAALW